MALWGGRFSQAADAKFQQFNDSLRFDYRLAEQDIVGSIAWSNALCKAGVLTTDEQQCIESALNDLKLKVMEDPSQILQSDAEDIHSWVEGQLISVVGDLGKKLHTGRSRNDQVATDLKLWCKQQVPPLLQKIDELQKQLAVVARQQQATVLPGYTHLQRAQPVTFAHWCLAYVEMLERDFTRLQDAQKRMDTCPLGSGALAGTGFAVNRHELAHSLGFSSPTRNSLDSVSDRDHVLELMNCAVNSMMHLSRFAEDLIFYNSGESGFLELSDRVTSGSSLMPQKKNPDALELIRGKTGRVFGAYAGMMMTLKALPLAYNKDMQEDKEGLFDALDTWHDCLEMAEMVLHDLKLNEDKTREAAQGGYSNATEMADYLVNKGVPFREAHHIVGAIVVHAINKKLPMEDLPLADFKQFSPLIEDDVFDKLSLESSLASRCALGGVAPDQVEFALTSAERRLTKRDSSGIAVRSARLTDLDAIARLVNYWANIGENLPRDRKDLVKAVGEFAVTEVQGQVSGCASLYVYDTGLAEVRSLGVEPGFQNQGQGSALVDKVLQKAEDMSIDKVFVLTRVPEFFIKQGFSLTSKSLLPEKVMKDCDLCPRQHACDEVALEIVLKDKASLRKTER